MRHNKRGAPNVAHGSKAFAGGGTVGLVLAIAIRTADPHARVILADARPPEAVSRPEPLNVHELRLIADTRIRLATAAGRAFRSR